MKFFILLSLMVLTVSSYPDLDCFADKAGFATKTIVTTLTNYETSQALLQYKIFKDSLKEIKAAAYICSFQPLPPTIEVKVAFSDFLAAAVLQGDCNLHIEQLCQYIFLDIMESMMGPRTEDWDALITFEAGLSLEKCGKEVAFITSLLLR